VEEDSSSSFSSSKSLPISANVSVKSSISLRSGVFPSIPSIVLVNLVTTSCAQLISLPMSPIAPLIAFPISGIMPLSRSKALSCTSEMALLLRFPPEQPGTFGGVMLSLLSKAVISSWVFLTLSRY
jgi:hypothetical protein